MTVLLTVVFFALCMGAMAVGVLVSDRALRGSCGGGEVHGSDGEVLSCGACPKKEQEICPSDDPMVALAQVAYPGRERHPHP